MDDIDSAALTRDWWRALTAAHDTTISVERWHELLSGLVKEFWAALDAENFDADAGALIGEALANAHLVDEMVPSVSAQVLGRLTQHCDRPDAVLRMAGLTATLGQSHQREVARARAEQGLPVEQTVAQRERAEQDARFRILFDNTAVAIAIGDTDGILLDANSALADMIGVPIGSLQGISVYDFAHPDDRGEIRDLLYDNLVPAREGTVMLDQRLVRADGSVGWMTFAITYVKGSRGHSDHLLAIGADITEQHRLQEELHRQARHDPLTGLANRRYLLERIQDLVSSAKEGDQAGLCFADLDHFKQVNDRYGHGVGDKVLVELAHRLHEAVHSDGCLVSRLGGDEFVALVPPPADADQVSVVANQLLSVFSNPVNVDGYDISVSASIGAVVTPVVGAEADTLLDVADAGLYYAKANGKGRWVLQTMRESD
ncbi:sensor domain-containing diguanylate cyclase [Nocardia callitridis]|uniref:sensor domain-containing diguanylate cyclase n=1 Tax=Nocardia callitridis TaxID=648753 RepID=UPI0031F1119B